jgi:hypothetical protein
MENYLSVSTAAKLSDPATCIKAKAKTQWKELKDAIHLVSASYKKKAAQKTFQYPEEIIANFNEFNYLCCKAQKFQ